MRESSEGLWDEDEDEDEEGGGWEEEDGLLGWGWKTLWESFRLRDFGGSVDGVVVRVVVDEVDEVEVDVEEVVDVVVDEVEVVEGFRLIDTFFMTRKVRGWRRWRWRSAGIER